MPTPKLLSKTKLLRGYRCEKCLYLTVHRPELEAPITPELQALFDQGNQVGEKARTYFPDGILVDNAPWDFFGSLQRTRELIAQGVSTLYEAAFEYAGCYARADIIQFNPESKRWRVYEVKSTTKLKPEHIPDLGIQTWVMAKSGLPLESIHLMHLNKECRYPHLENLFTTHDVTDTLRQQYLEIQPRIREFVQCLSEPAVPDIDINAHCDEPNVCGFKKFCFQEKKIPALSVLDLPGLRDKKWDYYKAGIIALDDPRLDQLNELQTRIVNCHQTGERFLNHEAIRTALASWQYPLIFLDFETINPAIPRYDGCKPFQQVPFQFSVHILEHPNATLKHIAFLHTKATDPRPTLIPALLQACGTVGSIVAYYSRFESDRIQELAEYDPSLSAELIALTERLVDPLPIMREAVYDPGFAASFSLKAVAPALLGSTYAYDEMTVANGNDAQRAYEELIHHKTSRTRKAELETAMLAYCEKDTLVMVELVKWLASISL